MSLIKCIYICGISTKQLKSIQDNLKIFESKYKLRYLKRINYYNVSVHKKNLGKLYPE